MFHLAGAMTALSERGPPAAIRGIAFGASADSVLARLACD